MHGNGDAAVCDSPSGETNGGEQHDNDESDFMSLRESPSDQYDIVQQLYVELEQEREASATAANEALSMILRLQGEKAAEKMEACQYRRMAEEKIHHTEESLAIFEEILYQKDTEITFLKFQLQDFEIELPVNKICPVKFYDIFEVPQCAEDSNSGPENKVFKDCISERKDVSLTTHKVPKENKDYLKDEEWLNKALLDDQYRTLLSAPRKGNCQDYNRACKNHKSVLSCCQNVEGLWQSEIRQLKMWLQVLEEDRRIIKQEDSNRGEQLKLLREISQQLSMLCSNSKISPLKKHCHEDDTSVISFMENESKLGK
ncbi:hypothetical protein Taro_011480 [Colocasia esculenta]|uniref:GTD-binding domain-containing protein n=1 Tax=Colocasia esculenta TaxID=4460 RepID=A0A843U6D7_COLES|nr:hypothetical protein [Colocasia esculenta]